MTTVSLADDFRDYVNLNWSAGVSKPSTIKVITFNRERLVQGYTSTSALLIHRGEVQFIPLDSSYESRAWGSGVMVYDKTSTAKVETYILEFQRLINAWEIAGGGAFTTGGIVMTAVESSAFNYTFKFGAVNEIMFYSKQAPKNTT